MSHFESGFEVEAKTRFSLGTRGLTPFTVVKQVILLVYPSLSLLRVRWTLKLNTYFPSIFYSGHHNPVTEKIILVSDKGIMFRIVTPSPPILKHTSTFILGLEN